MDAANAADSGPERPSVAADGAASAESVSAGLIDNASALWVDLKGLAHDHLELAALETRRAGESLVSIVAYGVVVGVLGVSAWLGLAAALVLWLIDRGVPASGALILAVLVNLAGAFGFVLAIRRTSQALRFPATVRALKPRQAGEPAVPAQAGSGSGAAS